MLKYTFILVCLDKGCGQSAKMLLPISDKAISLNPSELGVLWILKQL